jgi:hypothetical protein
MLKAAALGLAIFAVASFGGTLAAQTAAAPAEAQQPAAKPADGVTRRDHGRGL